MGQWIELHAPCADRAMLLPGGLREDCVSPQSRLKGMALQEGGQGACSIWEDEHLQDRQAHAVLVCRTRASGRQMPSRCTQLPTTAPFDLSKKQLSLDTDVAVKQDR